VVDIYGYHFPWHGLEEPKIPAHKTARVVRGGPSSLPACGPKHASIPAYKLCPSKIKPAAVCRSFEPLGPKGCGFYFAPPNDADTLAMLSKLSLSTYIPASSFSGRKESYAFKCDRGKMGYFLDPHQSLCVLRRGLALWQRFAWAAGATHERLSADSACALVPLELISKVSDCVPALGSLEVYLRWRDEQSGGGGPFANGNRALQQRRDEQSGGGGPSAAKNRALQQSRGPSHCILS
jgi:hypothetical protein